MEKISPVAYRLQLPDESGIHPVFHIALLKPVVGIVPEEKRQPLPPLSTDGHPLVMPSRIVAARRIVHQGEEVNQVLVEWNGLPKEEHSWEDMTYIQKLIPSLKLEDKLRSEEGRDVTVTLDKVTIVNHLAKELEGVDLITDETAGNKDLAQQELPIPEERPTCNRRSTQTAEFVYN